MLGVVCNTVDTSCKCRACAAFLLHRALTTTFQFLAVATGAAQECGLLRFAAHDSCSLMLPSGAMYSDRTYIYPKPKQPLPIYHSFMLGNWGLVNPQGCPCRTPRSLFPRQLGPRHALRTRNKGKVGPTVYPEAITTQRLRCRSFSDHKQNVGNTKKGTTSEPLGRSLPQCSMA